MDKVMQAAIAVLAKAGADTLPVDVVTVAQIMGYLVQPYSQARDLLDQQGLGGSTLSDGTTLQVDTRYYILYADNLMSAQKSWVLAHELGHIMLHLDPASAYLTGAVDTQRQEAEAEKFARHLLAPLPALYACGAKTPDEISALVGLSDNDCQTICLELKQYAEERERLAVRQKVERNYHKFRSRLFFRAHKYGITISALSASFVVVVAVLVGVYLSSASRWRAQLDEQSTTPTTIPVVQQDQTAADPGVDPVSNTSAETTSNENRIVYITREGDKYHDADCRYVAGREDTIWMTEAEAQRAGYEACAVCGG